MPGNPNWLIRFWQELERRKVFRVTATYTAIAYIIIEVFNIPAVPRQHPCRVSTLITFFREEKAGIIIQLPVTSKMKPESTDSRDEIWN